MNSAPFSRPPGELSCIIGNLFTQLEPPCGQCDPEADAIVLTGTTHSGKHGTLTIRGSYCIFSGDPQDLSAVLSGRCPEKGEGRGR